MDCSARNARYLSGGKITLQGNFDPSRLLSPPTEIKKMVTQMINEFGKDKYIVNLGHGILPNIPLENAKAFIDAVKEYKATKNATFYFRLFRKDFRISEPRKVLKRF